MDQAEIVASSVNFQEEDKKSVLQLTVELDEAWNNRDAQAFAALFDEDADFRFHTGEWIQGKDAIESFWGEEVLNQVSEEMRHKVSPHRIRFITDEIALGDGTVRVLERLEEEERVHLEAHGTMLATKKENRWYITAVRLTLLTKG